MGVNSNGNGGGRSYTESSEEEAQSAQRGGGWRAILKLNARRVAPVAPGSCRASRNLWSPRCYRFDAQRRDDLLDLAPVDSHVNRCEAMPTVCVQHPEPRMHMARFGIQVCDC